MKKQLAAACLYTVTGLTTATGERKKKTSHSSSEKTFDQSLWRLVYSILVSRKIYYYVPGYFTILIFSPCTTSKNVHISYYWWLCLCKLSLEKWHKYNSGFKFTADLVCTCWGGGEAKKRETVHLTQHLTQNAYCCFWLMSHFRIKDYFSMY